MKKRILSALAVFALALTFVAPAFAMCDQPCYAALANDELAYCDLDAAPVEWQDDILAARAAIIYSESWSVDGLVTLIYPDESTEVLPKFSDLFPGWDLPVVPVNDASSTNQTGAYARSVIFQGRIFIPAAGNYLAPTFCSFTGDGNWVYMGLHNFSGETYNAGLTNLATGQDYAWVTKRPTGTVASFPTTLGMPLGVRASTYSSPSYAVAEVWRMN